MSFRQTIPVGKRSITISDGIDVPDYLILNSRGFKRTGKSHFAGTMPGVIGWLPFDPNSRWTANKLQQAGAKIIMPTTDFHRVEDPEIVAKMELAQAKAYYWEYLSTVRAVFNRYLETPAVKSIVLDTGGQLFEDIMYAHCGRKTTGEQVAYGAPRQTLKEWFITPADKNVTFVHHARPMYVNRVKTDELEIDGCSKLPDWMSVEIEHFYIESAADAKAKYTRWGGMHPDNREQNQWTPQTFGIRILNATMNMDIAGKVLLGADCNYEMLTYTISPDLHAKYY